MVQIMELLKLITLIFNTMQPAYNQSYQPIEDDMMCLTINIYQESRGDGIASMAGIANNVYLRMESPFYPDNICGVVHQLSINSCGYSWWCDGEKDIVDLTAKVDRQAFIQASIVADAFLNSEEHPALPGFEDALLYHSPKADPNWAHSPLTKPLGWLGSHLHYAESRTVAIR